MSFSLTLIILACLALIASVAAWLNTQTIIKDLAVIKNQLGIKEEKKHSFLDNDLDHD